MQVYCFLLDFLVKLKRSGHKIWDLNSRVDEWQFKKDGKYVLEQKTKYAVFI